MSPGSAGGGRFVQPRYLRPGQRPVGADGVCRYDGLTYASTPGYRPRLLDLSVPASTDPVPVVVWVHGGGWHSGDRRYTPVTFSPDDLFGSIVAAGMAVASVDYRHSLEASFPAQLHDVKAAIRYLRHFADDLGLDGGRLGVWGESAGGHLASLAALTSGEGAELDGAEGIGSGSTEVTAAGTWYAPFDLVAWLDHGLFTDDPSENPTVALLGGLPGERIERARAASPLTYVRAGSPPFLIAHGTADELVPFGQSETFAERLRDAGVDVTLTLVPDAGHVFSGADTRPLLAEAVEFFASRLLSTTPISV